MTAFSTRNQWNPVDAIDGSKSLFLICAYGMRARKAKATAGFVRRALRLLTLPNLRAFIAVYRDFYANPRDLDYMLTRAREVAGGRRDGRVDVIVDSGWGDSGINEKNHAFDARFVVDLDDIEAWKRSPLDRGALAAYEQVVLFYPDALGLGHSATERRLTARGAEIIAVYNGRRRCFLLDSGTRRSLTWRRFFARTRICELGFALAVTPLAAALSFVDMVKAGYRR